MIDRNNMETADPLGLGGLLMDAYLLRQLAEQGAAMDAALEGTLLEATLRAKIVAFWLEPEHRKATTWTEHRDINGVMLASALAPEGLLVLRAAAAP